MLVLKSYYSVERDHKLNLWCQTRQQELVYYFLEKVIKKVVKDFSMRLGFAFSSTRALKSEM
jgi:hypothetical protein